jgi:hypothetical protein
MPEGCEAFTWGWAVGVGNVTLPKEAGTVWGAFDTSKVVLQMRYNNQNLETGRFDSSGVDVKFTTKLRPYDAGFMVIGKSTKFFEVPPGQKEYNITGICDESCSSKLKGDIYIFSYIFHGHLHLRKIKSTLLKPDGSPHFTIQEDNFSFDHQRLEFMDEPTKVKPGFKVYTECSYDTENRTTVLKGGESTDDEMCLNFLQYYPRENGIIKCFSDEPELCQNNQKIIRVSSR